ncbi:MAG: PHP domain-containing protein [Candidatus Limnocylindrales bacterium]|jgi:predicted metal-dependent phosphoesterase TrpH
MNGPWVVPEYPSRVDLHTHSRRSDGILEPRQLVEAAAAAGVRIVALSDHDTLAGVRELGAPGASALPLDLVPGVEINSVARGIDGLWEGELHILGLGTDPADDRFEAALRRQRDSRSIRFALILGRLREMGMPVDEGAEAVRVEPGSSLGRPQIARLLVAAGHAPSVDVAMRDLLARGKPAYVPRQGLGPREAIAAIRDAGGLPVLAHFADASTRRSVVADLMTAGLRGLEVHYRHFDAPTVAEMAALARELRLVPTGGSDYHGDGETYAEAHGSLFVPDEDAAALFTALGRAPVGQPAAIAEAS